MEWEKYECAKIKQAPQKGTFIKCPCLLVGSYLCSNQNETMHISYWYMTYTHLLCIILTKVGMGSKLLLSTDNYNKTTNHFNTCWQSLHSQQSLSMRLSNPSNVWDTKRAHAYSVHHGTHWSSLYVQQLPDLCTGYNNHKAHKETWQVLNVKVGDYKWALQALSVVLGVWGQQAKTNLSSLNTNGYIKAITAHYVLPNTSSITTLTAARHLSVWAAMAGRLTRGKPHCKHREDSVFASLTSSWRRPPSFMVAQCQVYLKLRSSTAGVKLLSSPLFRLHPLLVTSM